MPKKIIAKKAKIKGKVRTKRTLPKKYKGSYKRRGNDGDSVIFPSQWGKKAKKLLEVKNNLKFNRLKGVFSESPASMVDMMLDTQKELNSHVADALRCYEAAKIPTNDVKAYNPATRGELGTAPAHYSHGKLTPWEVIDDWSMDYYCGNAMKYVCRHKHKGKPVEDIQKAIDCLIKYKSLLEKEKV